MIAFEPVGLVTRPRLLRFMQKYYLEIACLFEPPFADAMTPEQYVQYRKNVRDFIVDKLEQGIVPTREDDHEGYLLGLKAAFEVHYTVATYQAAHTHLWRLAGGVGTPPTAPFTDPSLETQEDRDYEATVQAVWTERAARYREVAAQLAMREARAQPTTEEDAPEDRQMLRATEYGSPEDDLVPDADRIDWPGKLHYESPRDMMRPYLEKIGRLDLLDGYSDEIIQYGDRVEYKIDGKWR